MVNGKSMLSVTATNLPRLLACNGSRSMVGFTSNIETDNTVRDEGNAVHWLAEQVYKGNFQAEELVDKKAPNGIFITGEMVEHIEEYLELLGQGGNIEIDTSIGNDKWQINARADHIKYDNGTLYVDDLKYGWSFVEVTENWTLIAHAIGFCIKNSLTPQKIVFRIYQPRPYNKEGSVKSWEINYDKLVEYYHHIDKILSNPDNNLNTGSHCKNCPAIATCPARIKAELNAIDVSEIQYESTVSNEELSFKLDQLSRAKKVLEENYNAYSEMALHRLKAGEVISNYSLNNQLSNREWKEHVSPDFLLALTGKNLTKAKLITPAQAEKEGVSKELVEFLTERFNKGVKLSRIDSNKKASKMFNNQ